MRVLTKQGQTIEVTVVDSAGTTHYFPQADEVVIDTMFVNVLCKSRTLLPNPLLPAGVGQEFDQHLYHCPREVRIVPLKLDQN